MNKLSINTIQLLTIAIVIFPIADIYATIIPSLSIGKILVLSSLLILIFKKYHSKLLIPTKYFVFFCYMILIQIVLAPYRDWFVMSVLLHQVMSLFLFSFFILFGSIFFDIEYGIKVLKKVAIFASIFLIIQELFFLLLGFRIPGLIPGLSLTNLTDSNTFINGLINSDRSSSFFAEPAHFSQYVCLALILCLFEKRNEQNRNNLKIAGFITFSMIISRSGNGLVLITAVWAFWLLYQLILSKNIKRLFQLTILVLFFAFAFFILYKISPQFNELVGRLNEIGGSVEGHLSGFLRIVRGYLLFFDMTTFEKIFGIGSGNVENYINIHPNSLYTAITNKLINYLNGFQEVLISGGIIGLILYLRFNVNIFKTTSTIGKVCILTLFFLSLISSCYNNSFWVLYLVFPLSYSYRKLVFN